MLEDKEKKMAIGSAVQRGNSVNVYNERGVMLFSKVGELIGYTGTTSAEEIKQLLIAIKEYKNSAKCVPDISRRG